jgi:hypothetical protein
MLQYLRAELRTKCCGLQMGQEERAKVEFSPAAGHLWDRLRLDSQQD